MTLLYINSMYGRPIKQILSIQKLSNSSSYFVEVTPYIRLSQKTAACAIGMSSVELSKRFKEATAGRKWPNRTLLKLDYKINNPNQTNLSKIQQQSMELWIEERQQLEERVFVDVDVACHSSFKFRHIEPQVKLVYYWKLNSTSSFDF